MASLRSASPPETRASLSQGAMALDTKRRSRLWLDSAERVPRGASAPHERCGPGVGACLRVGAAVAEDHRAAEEARVGAEQEGDQRGDLVGLPGAPRRHREA